MRCLYSLATALLLSLPAQAAELQPADSSIQFSGTQMGRTFDGDITRFNAEASFDDQHRLQTFTLRLPAIALTTGNHQRDTTLQSTEWLNSEQFPEIHFSGTTSAITTHGVTLDGQLEIKGTRLPLQLQVIHTIDNNRLQLHARGEIDRIKYQLGTGDWLDTQMVSQMIQFEANLSFQK